MVLIAVTLRSPLIEIKKALPLKKVTSGGELSRTTFAVHVILSQKIAPPTLIFDEVDIGISGGTAEIVGQMLKKLAKNTQILCITHRAQVSAQGDQHLRISKRHDKNETTSLFPIS